ncbi:MAG: transcription termination factor Rho [Acidobacteriota bacterium]|nr:transcription termination factor Rho [Acidobacteriota bacterium]MDQ2979764.1 transcription termination factor Rho [Acidobacteriota bacterium]
MSEDPLVPPVSASSISVQTESPGPGDGGSRPHRRRRRRRRRGGGGPGGGAGRPPGPNGSGEAERADEIVSSGPERPVEGVLYLPPKESAPGVLVTAKANYLPSPKDPIVPRDLISREGLEPGAFISGFAVDGSRSVVRRVERVEGLEPAAFRQRPSFSELVSIDPHDHLKLETEPDEMCGRVTDLLAPIGRGQRCLIVAPPKAGKTTLLKRMAHAVSVNDPDVYVIVLLIDERPEEITDFRRSVRGEVIASSADLSAENHIAVAEIVAERARRLVECGKHAIIFLDSITRMARAYNHMQKGGGKIMSGGIDARTMEKPRRFFGAARNAEGGGSLTIIATALIDTGSRMDEIIFQEFKGTGNTEIVLDRDLFNRRIFPCINIPQSGTRKEEKLYNPEELPRIVKLRRALAAVDKIQAMELVLGRLSKFQTNADFLKSF